MSQTKKIILGLDPGLADTGFGVIAKLGSHLSFIDAGSIRTAKSQNFIDRLVIIHRTVDQLIKKYRPDLIGVEKLYFAKNVDCTRCWSGQRSDTFGYCSEP